MEDDGQRDHSSQGSKTKVKTGTARMVRRRTPTIGLHGYSTNATFCCTVLADILPQESASRGRGYGRNQSLAVLVTLLVDAVRACGHDPICDNKMTGVLSTEEGRRGWVHDTYCATHAQRYPRYRGVLSPTSSDASRHGSTRFRSEIARSQVPYTTPGGIIVIYSQFLILLVATALYGHVSFRKKDN